VALLIISDRKVMMLRQKRLSVLLIAIIVIFHSEPTLSDVRNIFTISSIDYDGIGESTVLENTSVIKFHPRTSALVRLYHDNRANWNNNIVTLGIVINLDKHHYTELTYGYGRDSDKRRADYFSTE
jgi:hypothetical protein